MSRVPGWGWEMPPGAAQLIRAHFGASKCISERQNAFRSVKMHFGASKCISERQIAFRSVRVGGGLLRFEFRITAAGETASGVDRGNRESGRADRAGGFRTRGTAP